MPASRGQRGHLASPRAGPLKRSHDTSGIAWAKLLARIAEGLPLICPACGGGIRPISFIIDPAPIRKILTHVGEPLELPPVSATRGPSTYWGELVQVHDDVEIVQIRPTLRAHDRHPLALRGALNRHPDSGQGCVDGDDLLAERLFGGGLCSRQTDRRAVNGLNLQPLGSSSTVQRLWKYR